MKISQNYIFAIMLFIAAATLFESCKQKPEEATENAVTAAPADTSAIGKKITDLDLKIQADPANAALYNERAKLYMQRQEFEKAALDVKKVMQLDTTKAEYFITFSDLSLAANKPGLAKAALEKCLALEPQNKEGNMKLAELFFIARQYDKVFKYLNDILKVDIHNPKAYFMKGMAYKEMGDTAKSISSFQTAIEQESKYYDPFMQLGIIYTLKNNKLALQYFNGAITINPRSEEALYGRGMWYQEHAHDYDKAIQDYTSIIQLNPKNKSAHFGLGYIHYQYLKVNDQAIKHFTDAINADPSYAEAIYNRGLCYETVGNIGMARADYEAALRLRPDYTMASSGLSRVGS